MADKDKDEALARHEALEKHATPATPDAPAKGTALATTPSAGDPAPDKATKDNPEPGVILADKTRVVTIGGSEAAASDPSEGIGGMAHATAAGELMGGNIKRTLLSPLEPDPLKTPMTKERAALMSPIGQKVAGLVGRPVTEWGLIAEGETIKGHMLLLDLNTGQKVRGMDGHKVGEGELYANLRNFPEALSTGDAIDEILGG